MEGLPGYGHPRASTTIEKGRHQGGDSRHQQGREERPGQADDRSLVAAEHVAPGHLQMSWRLRRRLLPRAAGDVGWVAWGSMPRWAGTGEGDVGMLLIVYFRRAEPV